MKQDNDALSSFEDCLRVRQSKSPTHAHTAFVCHKLGSLPRSRADLTQIEYFLSLRLIFSEVASLRWGAIARSYFSLALALEEDGLFDEMREAKVQLHILLKSIKGFVNKEGLTEDFFQQLILFCHQ